MGLKWNVALLLNLLQNLVFINLFGLHDPLITSAQSPLYGLNYDARGSIHLAPISAPSLPLSSDAHEGLNALALFDLTDI